MVKSSKTENVEQSNELRVLIKSQLDVLSASACCEIEPEEFKKTAKVLFLQLLEFQTLANII